MNRFTLRARRSVIDIGTQWSPNAKVYICCFAFSWSVCFGCVCLCPGVGSNQERCGDGQSQAQADSQGATVVLEPYAPNILRVTLSLKREPAESAPGYGIIAAAAGTGWSASQTEQADVYHSGRIVATVDKDLPPTHPPLQTQMDIAKYFNGSAPGTHITLWTPAGKKLLEMTGWSQAIPNQKDGTADVLRDRRPTDAEFYTVGAAFASPDDEHGGLGQNHGDFWIIAATSCIAGRITWRRRRPVSVCHFW